ncbi:MAG TPA: hypothetical protein VKV04_16455, partial [Verrucomicrobiae bacterium]|nr:hypothetical protein [Verrucomicrobiae bacterium]
MNSIRINRGVFRHIAVLLVGLHLPMFVRGQLVADGQTNILNNVITNISGNLTVGTNGSFTLLVVTNGSTVSNSTDGAIVSIGANASAQSNRLIITDPGTSWTAIEKVTSSVGQSGSANELDILNGAKAINFASYIGQTAPGSNNLVLVSGAGSTWSNFTVIIGNGGPGNALIVTNGARVFTIFPASISVVGNSSTSSNNYATVSGAGSVWTNSTFVVGTNSSRMNQLNINNGARFGSAALSVGAGADSNVVTVTGAGSVLQCYGILLGTNSTGNECVVSNGAALYAGQAGWPTIIQGTASSAIITGAGSTWSNSVDFTFGQYSNLLSITDGGSLVDRNGLVRLNPGVFGNTAEDTIVIAGQNSIWNNRGLFSVAEQGLQLFITNGGTLVDGSANFGDFYSVTGVAGTFGNAIISGTGSLWSSRTNLEIGNVGASNQVVVTDSGMVTAGNLVIGNAGNGSQLTVSNSGTVIVTNQLSMSGPFSKLTVSGGSVIVTNSASLAIASTLAINSGFFTAGSLLAASNPQPKVLLKGGTLQLGSTIYSNLVP